ncbi:hypothetical protein [Micromonospora sp. DT227]|uniref:hypothetical protein n=1 Tax=Micromonospora sp. DT227 TaxID=3393433 RepID=UPI003CEA2623
MNTTRAVRCRYLDVHAHRGVNRCTGEAADPNAELVLCTGHLAAALRLVDEIRGSLLTAGGVR